MERVAFVVESTGERLGCLLNPESLVLRRLAGIRPRLSIHSRLASCRSVREIRRNRFPLLVLS